MNNRRRADAAESALSEFTFQTYGRRYAYQLNKEDREAAFSDLLGDLMHYARRQGFDFEDNLALAKKHYEVEATWDWDEETGLDPKPKKKGKHDGK